MLTPHFAGYFGYRGPILHIAPHPLPTCCWSLKRDGEDVAWKTKKKKMTSSFAFCSMPPSPPLPPRFLCCMLCLLISAKWGLIDRFLSFFFPCPSFQVLLHFLHLFVPSSLCSWFDSFGKEMISSPSPLTLLSLHSLLLDNIALLLCWIMETDFHLLHKW